MPKRLRYFMRRDGAVLVCQQRSFPVDACVCIAAHDRVGLKRLLRYCADRAILVCWNRIRHSGLR